MKHIFISLVLFARKIDHQYIQLALVVLSLVVMVLGTGAPTDGGGGR